MSNFKIIKFLLMIIILCLGSAIWFVYSEIYTAQAQKIDKISFEIKQNESVAALADRLAEEQVVRNAWLFKKYLVWKKVDKEIRSGTFEINSPITLSRVVKILSEPGVNEKSITIIPGWNIRNIATYFENERMFQAEEITEYVGLPAVDYRNENLDAPKIDLDLKILKDKPAFVSHEGYLAPETYRIYADATVPEIIEKLLRHREKQITDEMWNDIEKSGRSFYEILTMASIVEREVRGLEDRKKVADIFWRRYDKNWALQADSTVHFAVNKSGDVFTTAEDRNSLSPWNTYKYPGLPLGPICNPSLESIEAVIYPTKNNDWYFLTTAEGDVKYAESLEGHNKNRARFL